MELTVFDGAQCVRLASAELELFVTIDCGPRIIGLRQFGGTNLMCTYPEQLSNPHSSEFQLFGGHRLWTAPEVPGFTDEPDNAPVSILEEDGWTIFTTEPGPSSKIVKRMAVKLEGRIVHLQHRLTNAGDKTVRVAPWALTVMAPGGLGLTPQDDFVPHGQALLPARPLVLWTYTEMDDNRFNWGRLLIRLRQDPGMGPTKYGAFVRQGYAGYCVHGCAFIKKFPAIEGADYPDYGCNFETFTRHDMLEVESVGPLASLAPGDSVDHPETWGIFSSAPPHLDEDDARAWLDGFAKQVPAP